MIAWQPVVAKGKSVSLNRLVSGYWKLCAVARWNLLQRYKKCCTKQLNLIIKVALRVLLSNFWSWICPQVPPSVWSVRTAVPCVRPLPDWSWRTNGSSACGMSFRRPTAARIGPSTFWPAATFKPAQIYAAAEETQSELRFSSRPAIKILIRQKTGQQGNVGARGVRTTWHSFLYCQCALCLTPKRVGECFWLSLACRLVFS